MKTQINNIEQVTETGLLKAIALKQFNGEDFFIVSNPDEVIVFEGTQEEAEETFNKSGATNEDSFTEWALENLIRVTEIEDDEERENHIVLTDEEADEKAKESITNSLWAFNPSFLASQTGLDEEIFTAIQDNGKCEDNNDTIYNTIQKLGNMKDFVSEAISADGRGHFMNSYDGNENEETVNGETFYIYRMN